MRCPICRYSMSSNAKRCPPCAARRKLLRDRKYSAAKRARIRRSPRYCLHPECRVNLRGTRRQRCEEHARARVNAARRWHTAMEARAAEIAAEEEIPAVTPWDDIVRARWES